jgi:GNAT superfamily N-acetyltransferase
MSVSLRAAVPGDRPFLERVYASTREDELRLVPWSDEEKRAFVRQQFTFQDLHYRQEYTDAAFLVIEWDGRPVGRLYLDHRADEVRVVDIAVLPEWRGRGIGTALLQDVLREAARSGASVSIHVERGNGARRLYERLGFRPVDDNGVYVLMRAEPTARS